MTQKELNVLAREYAESTAMDVVECLLTEHGAFHAFKWLSERYVIVAKEKVRENYQEAEMYATNHDIENWDNRIQANAIKSVLQSLFPQTLKSEEK